MNSSIMRLNLEFYPLTAIEEAITDFGENFDIDIIERDGKYIAIKVSSDDCETLKKELSNYIIGTIKNRGVL